VTANWVLLGSLRYDLINEQFDQARIGVGYVDDCFMLSVNWLEGYTYTPTQAQVRDSTIMFQFSLRTLGPDVLAPIASSF
jgi:LPS-assembly protein